MGSTSIIDYPDKKLTTKRNKLQKVNIPTKSHKKKSMIPIFDRSISLSSTSSEASVYNHYITKKIELIQEEQEQQQLQQQQHTQFMQCQIITKCEDTDNTLNSKKTIDLPQITVDMIA